jgi:protoporphyrinogen IX oxidase
MLEVLSVPGVYNAIKALHVISIIAWMAGLLYLPRLFVYHADTPLGSDKSETFKIMERRLLRIIMNPAMCAAWLFGLLMLAANPELLGMAWMHVKLTGVILMTGVHHVFARFFKAFRDDRNVKPARYYRIWNEIPTLLMIIIVIMAVVEPF